jgi:hypothetical protein
MRPGEEGGVDEQRGREEGIRVDRVGNGRDVCGGGGGEWERRNRQDSHTDKRVV